MIRNDIIMQPFKNPQKVTLPNGRFSYVKYKRVKRSSLPQKFKMQRKYSKRKKRGVGKSKKAALTIVLLQSDWDIQKRRRKYRKQTGRGPETVLKKAFNVITKLAKSDVIKMIKREEIKKARVYRLKANKVKKYSRYSFRSI